MKPVIAIIPARGGSIRLPRKNAKKMCGHPLVAWSIVQAANSRLVDYVVLTTDDDELEDIGNRYGADEVIRRPDSPDADQVAANRPFYQATEILAKRLGDDGFDMVHLLPTSPQRKPDDIDRLVRKYQRTQIKTVAMIPMRECFIYKNIEDIYARAIIMDKFQQHMELASGIGSVVDPRWYMWYDENVGTETHHDSFFNELMKDPANYPDNTFPYIECEAWQQPECDVLAEFELCELILEHYILKGRGMSVYEEYGGTEWEAQRKRENAPLKKSG